jgi:hypothetical protein
MLRLGIAESGALMIAMAKQQEVGEKIIAGNGTIKTQNGAGLSV